MRTFLFIFLLLGASFVIRGQFEVDTSRSIEELVVDVLINSSCAETSNYSASTGSAFGFNGIGYFNANDTRFPYREGIILSTGNARNAIGPNNRVGSGINPSWPGDLDLRSATGTGNLFNASYIQFDFVPTTNSISFNFIFASEEYSAEYQCIYSDVFAFILTDAAGEATNLAVIPGTNRAVSATSIRPGVDNACGPRNEEFFAGTNGADSAISFEGQTVSLQAVSEVIPGETYNIKLVIADNLDSELDSAVFLEAGSFSIDVDLGEDRTVASNNPLCIGENLSLDATAIGAIDYRWSRNGQPLPANNGMTTLNVDAPGNYEVEVVFSALCISSGAVAVEYIAPPRIDEQPLNLVACDLDGDGNELFDFRANAARMLGSQDRSIYEVAFFNSRAEAEANANRIETIASYPGTLLPETIHARLSSGDSCYEIASFNISVQALEVAPTLEESYVICLDGNGAALEPFTVLDVGLDANEFTFQWYRGTLADENRIPNANNRELVAMEPGDYVVEVSSTRIGCVFSYGTQVLPVRPPSAIEVAFTTELFSGSNGVRIEVEGDSDYLFAVDDGAFSENPDFDNLAPGEHLALVQDTEGCTVQTKPFFVIDYPRFFTPNGDGFNDVWRIVGIEDLPSPTIKIYDRYGQLYHQFSDDSGWDGNHPNRSPAPATDYWFTIAYELDGVRKEFKNHFSLKR
ncbi:choice-of-anchor L domain-containing protein [Maribacter sp. 2307ULW6-5]|uniref:choice-of-anchor L domain-containing protein n=1 Tax=Maribacter sp. 2307ULW6-5 TaxID=3386275 RepID=UPI0039BD723B